MIMVDGLAVVSEDLLQELFVVMAVDVFPGLCGIKPGPGSEAGLTWLSKENEAESIGRECVKHIEIFPQEMGRLRCLIKYEK